MNRFAFARLRLVSSFRVQNPSVVRFSTQVDVEVDGPRLKKTQTKPIKILTGKHRRFLQGHHITKKIQASSLVFFLNGQFPSTQANMNFRLAAEANGFQTKEIKTSILKNIAEDNGFAPGVAGGKMFVLTHKDPISNLLPANIKKMEKLLGPFSKVGDSTPQKIVVGQPVLQLVAMQLDGRTLTRAKGGQLVHAMKEMPVPADAESFDYKEQFYMQLVASLQQPATRLVQPLTRVQTQVPDTLSSAVRQLANTLGMIQHAPKHTGEAAQE